MVNKVAGTGEKLVRLYYLGGIKTTRQNQTVSSGRDIYKLPPKGEFLDLPEHVAIDLERKHKYILDDGDTVSAFTRDIRVAKRVLEGMTAQQAYAPRLTVSDFSDEEILEELEKRGLSLESDEDPEKEPVEKPAPKTRAKPRAKSKAATKAKQPDPIDPLSTGV